jgi:hypothetical protein
MKKEEKIKKVKSEYLFVAYTGENYTALVGYGDFIGCFNTEEGVKKYIKFIEEKNKEKIDYKIKKIVISEYKK